MSKRPAWMDRVLAYQKKELLGLEKGRDISVPLAGRRSGWQFVGEFISGVPDAAHPWDPAVVKAIHRDITTDIVPIWIRRVYLKPDSHAASGDSYEVFGRHGLAQKVRYSPQQAFDCQMPSGYSFTKPNSIYWVPWGERDPRARDLPGAYVPFDWRFYKHVKNNFRDWDVKALQQNIRESEYEHERALAKARAEHRRGQEELERYANKRLQSVSDAEFRDHFLGKYEGRR